MTAALDASRKSAKTGFVAIPAMSVRATEPIACDLFVAHQAGTPPALFRSRVYPITKEDLQRLRNRGVGVLYIKNSDYALYQEYIDTTLQETLHDTSLAPRDRFAVLQTWTIAQLCEVCNLLSANTIVERSQEIGRRIAEFLIAEEPHAATLFEIMEHDASTCTHLLNVSSYATLLARRLGVTCEKQLTRITVGGLLHDLGMRKVPAAILNNPWPLTPSQRAAVERHPHDGFVELHGRDDLEWGQLMMVYQHHERWAGGGYPTAVRARDIHWCGALCAVVDVFDALTGKRPYRRPLGSSDALDFINTRAGKHFDEELTRCFSELISGG